MHFWPLSGLTAAASCFPPIWVGAGRTGPSAWFWTASGVFILREILSPRIFLPHPTLFSSATTARETCLSANSARARLAWCIRRYWVEPVLTRGMPSQSMPPATPTSPASPSRAISPALIRCKGSSGFQGPVHAEPAPAQTRLCPSSSHQVSWCIRLTSEVVEPMPARPSP